MRKIDEEPWWPELLELKDELSLRELADRFGVSSTAIRSTLRRKGIPSPPRERVRSATDKAAAARALVQASMGTGDGCGRPAAFMEGRSGESDTCPYGGGTLLGELWKLGRAELDEMVAQGIVKVRQADEPAPPRGQPEGVERLWHLDPNDLEIPEHRLRAPKSIEGLAQSMADLGQLQPVIVAGDARTVLAGARRVLAARSLGWDLVACVATDADQVLVEIDENLKRQELTAMERIKHLEARRRAYEAAFPETRRGVAGGKARQGAATDTPSFAADASAKLGVSERTIQRQVRLAQDLDDEACELLKDHDVADNAAELTRLAKLEPEDQRAAAELLAEGKARTVKAAKRQVEQAKPVADAPEAPPSIDLRCGSNEDLLAGMQIAALIDGRFDHDTTAGGLREQVCARLRQWVQDSDAYRGEGPFPIGWIAATSYDTGPYFVDKYVQGQGLVDNVVATGFRKGIDTGSPKYLNGLRADGGERGGMAASGSDRVWFARHPGRLPSRAQMVHADPNWAYSNSGWNGAAEKHYDVAKGAQGMEGIVQTIDAAYDLADDDCYLVLWCTGPFLRPWFIAEHEAGLRWQSMSAGAWGKNDGRIGTGVHWRGDAEFPLLYTKGKPEPRGVLSNLFLAPRLAHSEKDPGILAHMVRTFSPPQGRVLDLYAGRAPLARACLATGRSYLGAEIDPHRHAAALQALAGERDERQPELFGGAA